MFLVSNVNFMFSVSLKPNIIYIFSSKWPWCYNSESNSPRWEYCDIPICATPSNSVFIVLGLWISSSAAIGQQINCLFYLEQNWTNSDFNYSPYFTNFFHDRLHWRWRWGRLWLPGESSSDWVWKNLSEMGPADSKPTWWGTSQVSRHSQRIELGYSELKQ